MQKNYSFSVPSDVTIVEDVEKLCGRMPRAQIIREALMLYQTKIKGEDAKSCPLPGWEHFEKFLFNSNKAMVEEALSRCKQLTNVASEVLSYKEKRKKLAN